VLGIRPFHAGRTDRHAGNGDALYIRSLLQQPLDDVRRDMALHEVVTRYRRVAGRDVVTDTQLRLCLSHIRAIDRIKPESIVLQMFDPFVTAAAGRALAHRDLDCLTFPGLKQTGDQDRGEKNDPAPSQHPGYP
jgi:hypothetical protein